jgi:hypothetical protein
VLAFLHEVVVIVQPRRANAHSPAQRDCHMSYQMQRVVHATRAVLHDNFSVKSPQQFPSSTLATFFVREHLLFGPDDRRGCVLRR